MPKIIIDTDGSKENTKLTIDGRIIEDLADFSMYADFECWCGCTECECCGVNFSYATKKKEDDMTVRTRYTLDQAKASFTEEDDAIVNPTSEDFKSL